MLYNTARHVATFYVHTELHVQFERELGEVGARDEEYPLVSNGAFGMQAAAPSVVQRRALLARPFEYTEAVVSSSKSCRRAERDLTRVSPSQ